MRPAMVEYWARCMWPLPFKHGDGDSKGDFTKDATDWWLDRVLPAHWLDESHGDEWFDDIAWTFNAAKTPSGKPLGIIFNVFEPGTGKEYLHANDEARRQCRESDDIRDSKKIDGEAVRNALRFWLYGFERPLVPWSYWFGVRSYNRIDGGYHRQIILRELHVYDRIYVVRPQAQRWIGELPRNSLELADFIIELWFNSSYPGEKAGLELINKLLREEKLTDKARTEYKHVDLPEVEVEKNYGFTDYFGEKRALFFAAKKESLAKFQEKCDAPEVISESIVAHLPSAA